VEDNEFVRIMKELYPNGYESFVINFERHKKDVIKMERELKKSTS